MLTPLAKAATPAYALVALPVVALLAGGFVYWDSRQLGMDAGVAALFGFVVGGLFLAGSVPALVALAFTSEAATQGFPTAVRVVPGVAAILVYGFVRRRLKSHSR